MSQVRGYITKLDIDSNSIDVSEIGSNVVKTIPGLAVANMEIRLIGGDFQKLFEFMSSGALLEIELPGLQEIVIAPKEEVKDKKVYCRMLRIENAK